MAYPTTASAGRHASTSWIVILGALLAAASALTLLGAAFGYRYNLLTTRTALLTVQPWGAYFGIAAAVVSLVGLVLTLRRPAGARRGVVLAVVCLGVGVSLAGRMAQYKVGPQCTWRPSLCEGRPPGIHDITTDTADPPEFVAVLPLRATAVNKVAYGGDKIAAQQHAFYPDLQPVMLTTPPDQTFDRALAAVKKMGWDLVAADKPAGRIEATDTTFWFRFKDDVVIRLRPSDGGGTRMDIRSLSRVGGGDVGTNAKRIRAYLRAFQEG